ncbi:ABC transporter ATP-binding protein [Streptomyces sp. WMMC500]|uniref:ABC transporter ATP-binding protein n=1 Tax=Streptomyces sp. WMMC500 TaxID=3015154 RepID=UPI00248B9843|nr:ABC transporter ATP-binding protein [Streptomyces sp. WMMC500]WBB60589.1 ABC transporter ATP-binding protein [Streptomyces sp. WMMC500]
MTDRTDATDRTESAAGTDRTGSAAGTGPADGGAGAAAPLLVLDRMSVRFRMPRGRYVAAVTDVSLALAPGECVALVGESGCGKSVLASALLGLLPENAETAGAAHLGDLELLGAGEAELARRVRGRRVGLIPQSPAAHLTPVRTVRAQLQEVVRELTDTRKPGLRAAAEEAAARAAFPADHLDRYPHELSGGLAQRAATALALVGGPPLLLADEPTTGLDRDLVERTVDELRRRVDDGHGLLMITHDLAAAERIADRVAVMYAGRIVELADAAAFFGAPGPRHPYARGLLDALPERGFTPIPGLPPELGALPPGCAFAPRCTYATAACEAVPALTAGVACHHPVPADTAPPEPGSAGAKQMPTQRTDEAGPPQQPEAVDAR